MHTARKEPDVPFQAADRKEGLKVIAVVKDNNPILKVRNPVLFKTRRDFLFAGF